MTKAFIFSVLALLLGARTFAQQKLPLQENPTTVTYGDSPTYQPYDSDSLFTWVFSQKEMFHHDHTYMLSVKISIKQGYIIYSGDQPKESTAEAPKFDLSCPRCMTYVEPVIEDGVVHHIEYNVGKNTILHRETYYKESVTFSRKVYLPKGYTGKIRVWIKFQYSKGGLGSKKARTIPYIFYY